MARITFDIIHCRIFVNRLKGEELEECSNGGKKMMVGIGETGSNEQHFMVWVSHRQHPLLFLTCLFLSLFLIFPQVEIHRTKFKIFYSFF
jgi:hypothetical protein